MTEWNDSWGDPADYNIVPGKTELEGFCVGERVCVTWDNEEQGHYEGDEGTIVGIAHTGPGLFNPRGTDDLIVAWDDGREPTGVLPSDVAVA